MVRNTVVTTTIKVNGKIRLLPPIPLRPPARAMDLKFVCYHLICLFMKFVRHVIYSVLTRVLTVDLGHQHNNVDHQSCSCLAVQLFGVGFVIEKIAGSGHYQVN